MAATDTVPYGIPEADATFWHGIKCDETLRILWSLGRGMPVPIGSIARYLDLPVEKACTWMRDNGHGLWECDERCDNAWKPLIGKHRRR